MLRDDINTLNARVSEIAQELRQLRNEVRKGRANAEMCPAPGEPSRHGMFWEEWEEENLERMYICMVPISQMAKRIGRTPLAIAARLEKLGLLTHVGGGVYIPKKHANDQNVDSPAIYIPRKVLSRG